MYNLSLPKYLKHFLPLILLFCIVTNATSDVAQVNDTLVSPVNDTTAITLNDAPVTGFRTLNAEELIRGERLFYGLAYQEDKSVNCASCHNTRVSDTLNWNPDALEISKKYLDKSLADLTKVLLNPTAKKMAEVHKGFQLTAEDIVLLKGYMDELNVIGIKQNKPVITNLLLLIIAGTLFLIAFIDLIIKKLFKNNKVNGLILLVTGTIVTYILVVNAIAFGLAKGFSPDQPIKFSHAVHAGQNKTDCIYCHYSAKISKTAGIPSGSVCLNCHFLVRNGTRSGVTEIAKVIEAYENKMPVEWIEIYNLPDFVFFSHQQHVNAGELTCFACHGDVKEIDRLYQEPDLSMGWCLDCHDTRAVKISNEYYKSYFSSYHDSVLAGKMDSVNVSLTGGRQCGSCHY